MGPRMNQGPKPGFIVPLDFMSEAHIQRYSYSEFQDCYLFPIVIDPCRCVQLNGFGQHDALTIYS